MKEEQLSLIKNSPIETCYTCELFSELKDPRKCGDGEDDPVIYGYCFKDGTKTYSSGMGKGYAVYVPEGSCKYRKN